MSMIQREKEKNLSYAGTWLKHGAHGLAAVFSVLVSCHHQGPTSAVSSTPERIRSNQEHPVQQPAWCGNAVVDTDSASGVPSDTPPPFHPGHAPIPSYPRTELESPTSPTHQLDGFIFINCECWLHFSLSKVTILFWAEIQWQWLMTDLEISLTGWFLWRLYWLKSRVTWGYSMGFMGNGFLGCIYVSCTLRGGVLWTKDICNMQKQDSGLVCKRQLRSLPREGARVAIHPKELWLIPETRTVPLLIRMLREYSCS